MDLATALKASPQAIAKRDRMDGTAYLVETQKTRAGSEYCLSTIDANGKNLHFYRYEDYEMERFWKRLAGMENDGWEPVMDAPTLQERGGRPYLLS